MYASNPTLDAVLDLNTRGLSVIPLRARDKVAAVKWEAYQTTRPTLAELLEWFANADRNVGIVTGAASGIVVVDVDKPELIDTLGPLPNTPTVKTGNGLHLYFMHPGRPVANKVGLLSGVDLRGDGGYVVAPPSIHPNGTPYEWIVGLDVRFAELPASVFKYETPRELRASNDNGQTTNYGRSWFADVETLAYTMSGRRNTLLNTVACKAGSLIASSELNEEEAINAMLDACQRNGLIEDDGLESAHATIRSGLRKGKNNPRVPKDGPISVPSPTTKLIYRKLSEIEEKPISWLWPGMLAKGALSLIAGPAGLGKSTITQDIAARVTSGDCWPASTEHAAVGNVIVLSLEDDAAARIKPRMIEAGADLGRVSIIEGTRHGESEGYFNLSQHVPLLDTMMTDIGSVSLVCIDPVLAYLTGDSNLVKDVRPVMTGLTNLAAKHGASILLVSHLNKNEAATAINRVQGSGAFVQAARVYYMIERDKDDPNRRIMTPGKNNLAEDNRGLGFRLESRTRPSGDKVQRVIWDDRMQETTADQVLSEKRKDIHCARDEAKEFLLAQLAGGPVPSAKILATAADSEIAEKTLRRANDALECRAFQHEGKWYWSLPDRL